MWFLQLVRLRVFTVKGAWWRDFRVPTGFLKLQVNFCVCIFLKRAESIAYISFPIGKVKNFYPDLAVRIL